MGRKDGNEVWIRVNPPFLMAPQKTVKILYHRNIKTMVPDPISPMIGKYKLINTVRKRIRQIKGA